MNLPNELDLPLVEYHARGMYPGCHLPILAARMTLRTLYLTAMQLSPAFLVPHALGPGVEYSTPRSQAIVRESRQIFDALILVAPRLHTLFISAHRWSQMHNNPETSHLLHLVPIFSAFRELRYLYLSVQLDTDPEMDELADLLGAMTCALHELRLYFTPLLGRVRHIAAAADILPTLVCLHRLRTVVVVIRPQQNDNDALEAAFQPFREFCQPRRVQFRGISTLR